MQCFQKDPNLRVSARKLLKHPWIVNARRSDSVVPKKPTEYEEAVKSVQQWNEALKSPNAGSLRKSTRPNSSSPGPGKREASNVLATPARGPLSLVKPRLTTEHFRSPDNHNDDNWDDDFASAISPSALQLPHLRPHDNFGGLLSAEKLKAYASFETVTEEENWDENFEGDLTVKSPLQVTSSDPLRTIRPYYPQRANTEQIKHDKPSTSPDQKRSAVASRHRTQAAKNSGKAKAPPASAAVAPTQANKGASDRAREASPEIPYLVVERDESLRKVYNNLPSTSRRDLCSLPYFRRTKPFHLDCLTLPTCMDLCSLLNLVVAYGVRRRLLDKHSCDGHDHPWKFKDMPRMRMTRISRTSSESQTVRWKSQVVIKGPNPGL